MQLRNNTKIDIERILSNYDNCNFDRIETAYLLIKLRAYLSNNSIMWDIASFIAHDNRNFGITYSHAKSSLDKLLLLMKPNKQTAGLSLITKGSFLIDQETICNSVEKLISQLGFNFRFQKNNYNFMLNVMENITGSKLVINGLNKNEITSFEVSEIITDAEKGGLKTIYAKVKPFPGKYSRDLKPQIHMDGIASIGFPLLQAVPNNLRAIYDPYVFTN